MNRRNSEALTCGGSIRRRGGDGAGAAASAAQSDAVGGRLVEWGSIDLRPAPALACVRELFLAVSSHPRPLRVPFLFSPPPLLCFGCPPPHHSLHYTTLLPSHLVGRVACAACVRAGKRKTDPKSRDDDGEREGGGGIDRG